MIAILSVILELRAPPPDNCFSLAYVECPQESGPLYKHDQQDCLLNKGEQFQRPPRKDQTRDGNQTSGSTRTNSPPKPRGRVVDLCIACMGGDGIMEAKHLARGQDGKFITGADPSGKRAACGTHLTEKIGVLTTRTTGIVEVVADTQ